MLSRFQKNVSLADYTTIGLGGPARYFYSCAGLDDLIAVARYVREKSLPLFVLGGGSNVIFADRGFDGLVLRIALRGVRFRDEGETVLARARAGEDWDSFVLACAERGLAGTECLSGIPGLAGAVPVQNVGAYGQEVRQTITRVCALDTVTLEEIDFTSERCGFAYRGSRFKGEDRGRFIISAVEFRLRKNGEPTLAYPELRRAAEAMGLDRLAPGRERLLAVRRAVLGLRRGKSMVVDPADPNSRSCGSFFLNPVIAQEDFVRLQERCREGSDLSVKDDIPAIPAEKGVKVPAAWLVERAGFPQGFRLGGAGISENHSLAIINAGGTTAEVLALAEEIRGRVLERFGIDLVPEPVVVD